MKRMTATITAALIISGMVTITSAHAGSARKHTLEGVMIGAGLTLAGAAILNKFHRDSTTVSYNYPHKRYHHPGNKHDRHNNYNKHIRYGKPDRHGRYGSYDRHSPHYGSKYGQRHIRGSRGYWKTKKIWVGPAYQKRWNPGHYNRRGAWVSGRYEKYVVKNGHWKQKKVWVWH